MSNLRNFEEEEEVTEVLPKINLGNVVVQHIAQASSNNLDTQTFEIDGVNEDNWGEEKVQEILKRSNWKILKKNLGKNLSLTGKQFVVVEKFEDKFYIDFIVPWNYEILGDEIIIFEGLTGKNYRNKNDISCQEIIKYRKNENGKVTYQFGYYDFDKNSDTVKFIPVKKQIVTSWTIIPVVIFKNNADSTSDVNNGNCAGIVETLNYISNILVSEVRDSKTFVAINSNLGKKLDERKIKEAQKEGVIKLPSPDSVMGQVIVPIQFSAVQIQQNLITVSKLQDDLLKFTFSFRDTYETGTNKHNAEVAISNQAAIEYLDFKREIRENDWSKVFQIILMVLKKDYKTKPKVKISLSEISENQIKATDTALVSKMQTESNLEIAKLNAKTRKASGAGNEN